MAVDFRCRAIRYYDSLGGMDHVACDMVKAWLQDDCLDKTGAVRPLSSRRTNSSLQTLYIRTQW